MNLGNSMDLSLNHVWEMSHLQWGCNAKSLFKYFLVHAVIMEIFFTFPAFSRSGREILLPTRISRSPFPVRELRSLLVTAKLET